MQREFIVSIEYIDAENTSRESTLKLNMADFSDRETFFQLLTELSKGTNEHDKIQIWRAD